MALQLLGDLRMSSGGRQRARESLPDRIKDPPAPRLLGLLGHSCSENVKHLQGAWFPLADEFALDLVQAFQCEIERLNGLINLRHAAGLSPDPGHRQLHLAVAAEQAVVLDPVERDRRGLALFDLDHVVDVIVRPLDLVDDSPFGPQAIRRALDLDRLDPVAVPADVDHLGPLALDRLVSPFFNRLLAEGGGSARQAYREGCQHPTNGARHGRLLVRFDVRPLPSSPSSTRVMTPRYNPLRAFVRRPHAVESPLGCVVIREETPCASPTEVLPMTPSPQDSDDQYQHFDDQSTSWTLIDGAHDPDAEVRYRAQALLIHRYDRVVRRYLAGALNRKLDNRDEIQEAIAECVQRCWKRLVEGRFQAVSPAKGRFRNYLQTVLSNLVISYLRERAGGPAPLGDLEPPAPDPVSDTEYRDLFRTALLGRAMEQLQRQDQQKDQGFFTLLRARRDHPEASMAELAGRLSAGGQKRNENWVRVTLFRARQRLCELLRLEVALELDDRTTAAVDEELAEPGLLVYCQSAS